MEFELDKGNATYQIRSYHDGQVTVNSQTYTYPILVMPDLLLAPWGPDSFEDLQSSHFNVILPYKPQVILFGAGQTLRFPTAILYRELIDKNIGIEIMNTAAACRTYALLIAEGRKVAAALLC